MARFAFRLVVALIAERLCEWIRPEPQFLIVNISAEFTQFMEGIRAVRRKLEEIDRIPLNTWEDV